MNYKIEGAMRRNKKYFILFGNTMVIYSHSINRAIS